MLTHVPLGSSICRYIDILEGELRIATRAAHILTTTHRHRTALAGYGPGICEAELKHAVWAVNSLLARKRGLIHMLVQAGMCSQINHRILTQALRHCNLNVWAGISPRNLTNLHDMDNLSILSNDFLSFTSILVHCIIKRL